MLNFATGRHPLPCCHGRSWGDSDRFPKNFGVQQTWKKTWNKIRIKNQVHKFNKKLRLRDNGLVSDSKMLFRFQGGYGSEVQWFSDSNWGSFFFWQTLEATGSEETSAPRGAVQETHLVTWAKVAKEFFWALGSFKSKVENLWQLGRVWFFSLIDNYLDSYFDFQQFSTMGWNVRSLVDFILHQTNPIRFVCCCCSLRFSWVAPISCVDTCFETRPAIAYLHIFPRYVDQLWKARKAKSFSDESAVVILARSIKITKLASMKLSTYYCNHIIIHDHSSPIDEPTNTFSSPKWGCFRGQDCHCRTHWYRKDGQKQGANMTA